MQSCTVYHKTPLSLADAVGVGEVKVTNKIGEAFVFDRITLEKEAYYGIKGEQSTLIQASQTTAIYEKDVETSRTRSILVPLVVVGGVVLTVGILGALAYASLF